MKDFYLTILRDQTTASEVFRSTAKQLGSLLLAEAAKEIPMHEAEVETVLGTASGKKPACRIILVPILRAGLALLPTALELFPTAPIGMFGIRRDEKTVEPRLYYQNLPPLTSDDWILVLDPMLATAGSVSLALEKLLEAGARPDRVSLISIIASKLGVETVQKRYPAVKQIIAAVDPELNRDKFIVPGLGDFGDRYFGT